MVIGLFTTFAYLLFLWLFFVKWKIIKFNPVWGVVSFWFGLHLLLLFIIVPRFTQPSSNDARFIRHTIQIVPRLPEPTLLTEVLVEPNVHVKKGTPLFQFDKRTYEYSVEQAMAKLAAAKQNVLVMKAEFDAQVEGVAEAEANKAFALDQVTRYKELAQTGAASFMEVQHWQDRLKVDDAEILSARADVQAAQLRYGSNIDGVNTEVAQVEAELKQARYYLEQTTINAPEDGFITNLQARPGLVVGDRRIGAIRNTSSMSPRTNASKSRLIRIPAKCSQGELMRFGKQLAKVSSCLAACCPRSRNRFPRDDSRSSFGWTIQRWISGLASKVP